MVIRRHVDSDGSRGDSPLVKEKRRVILENHAVVEEVLVRQILTATAHIETREQHP
jgi:hypothetical protein